MTDLRATLTVPHEWLQYPEAQLRALVCHQVMNLHDAVLRELRQAGAITELGWSHVEMRTPKPERP